MKPLLLSLLAIAVISSPATAQAQPAAVQSDLDALFSLKPPAPDKAPVPPPKPVEPPRPQPTVYTVAAGDNLTKIGEAHTVAWLRIWQKNLNITNPDLIRIGDQLTIPLADEVLADRPLPAAATIPAPANAAAATQPRGAVAGNTYTPGQCTWYVKNKRPDLPNNLGNANTWYSRAAAQGIPVGSTPRAGAAAMRTAGMHVVYVEAVNPDGTITISEMNYNYVPYSTRTRIADPSQFLYIY